MYEVITTLLVIELRQEFLSLNKAELPYKQSSMIYLLCKSLTLQPLQILYKPMGTLL